MQRRLLYNLAMRKIRSLSEQDLPAVFAIEQENPSPWSFQMLQNCLAEPYKGLVLEVEGRVVGFGIIALAADECEIHNIVITADCRRHGYGNQLLQQLLALAKENSAHEVYLEVRTSNTTARSLYERAGFKSIGTRKGYYPTASSREDAIIYKLHPLT